MYLFCDLDINGSQHVFYSRNSERLESVCHVISYKHLRLCWWPYFLPGLCTRNWQKIVKICHRLWWAISQTIIFVKWRNGIHRLVDSYSFLPARVKSVKDCYNSTEKHLRLQSAITSYRHPVFRAWTDVNIATISVDKDWLHICDRRLEHCKLNYCIHSQALIYLVVRDIDTLSLYTVCILMNCYSPCLRR